VVVLFIFGMMVQGNLLAFRLDQLQLYSNTLQSIAVGYAVAAIAQLCLPVSRQVMLTAGLLVLFWILMMFVPFGGHPGGTLKEDANLALYVDHLILGHFEDGKSYTWILSSLGFAATVLMGVLSGHMLQMNKRPIARLGCLVAAGAGCLLAGWIWSFHFPIIKHLWTSSMALWAGGWCCLLLAGFYLVIDVWGLRRWAFPFIVIGMNAITAYMAWHLLPFRDASDHLLSGLADHLSKAGEAFLLSSGSFVLIWLVLLHLYRHKIFLKV
jgi:predicted acyltransferase